jgi:hypothetical protein
VRDQDHGRAPQALGAGPARATGWRLKRRSKPPPLAGSSSRRLQIAECRSPGSPWTGMAIETLLSRYALERPSWLRDAVASIAARDVRVIRTGKQFHRCVTGTLLK